jgi:Integrase core domain
LYLAIVLDVFSRKVVGWAMETQLRTELMLAAIDMAITMRQPRTGLIHHSDHGCQYTSYAFLGLPTHSHFPNSVTKVVLAGLRPRQTALLLRSIKIEKMKSQKLRR